MSEYADALPLLRAALADLRKGQLVQDQRYGMMDLMAAIEINDPRTDTYLHAKKQQEAHKLPLPPFDPSRQLGAEEIVWVVDEIVRLEATFLSGHPLSSTLWACNYLRPSSLSTLCFPSSPTSSPLMTIVFRALLLATLKSCEIVYEEMSKGRVYEHEDVHLPLSSLSFNTLMASCYPPLPSPPSGAAPLSRLALPGQDPHDPLAFDQPPPERTVSVDDVLRTLDEALRWLNEEHEGGEVGMDEEVRETLVTRVTMRIDLLYTIALLTAPAYTSPTQITHHLTRLSSYSSLFPSASSATSPSSPSPAPDPKPELLSIFHPSPSSVPLLGTQQPPRPTALLTVGEGYDLLLRQTVGDLGELMRLWESWLGKTREGGGGGEGGWREVREFALEAGRRGGSPYVRSVRQSVIAPPSPPNLFSSSPPRLLSFSFLRTLASLSLSPSLLSPSLPLLSWLDRLALQFLLPITSGLAGQNRGRQRRIVMKSAGAFVELVKEAEEEIVPLLLQLHSAASGEEAAAVRRVPLAMAAHALEVVLEALLSGFEEDVGLFREEEEARREGWYVAERMARVLRGMWEGLLLRDDAEGEGKVGWEEGREYVKRKKAEAGAVEGMCRGSWLTSLLSPSSSHPPKFSSPFLPSLSFPPSSTDAARGRFNQRFDWLGRLSSPSTGAFVGCEGIANWREYEKDVARLHGEEKTSLIAEAKTAFSRAIGELDKLERGGFGSSQQEDEWLSELRETAKANLTFLDSTSVNGGEEKTTTQLIWRSGWFAQWSRPEK